MTEQYPPVSPDRPSTRLLNGDEEDGIEEERELDSRQVADRSRSGHPGDGASDRITRFIAMLVGCSAVSGLLFGYDTGVISGTLVVIGSDLGHVLSEVEQETITSATTFGALLGGLASGGISDSLGRKGLIGIAGAVFMLGAIVQAASYTVTNMVAGRFIVGLGVGSASCIVPLYIGELSPSAMRGRLVTINCVAITLGQVVAYGIGASLQRTPNGWRWMVGLGAVPAAMQLAMLHLLPESPRVLVLRGAEDKAYVILARMYPTSTPEQLEFKLGEMVASAKGGSRDGQQDTVRQRLEKLFFVGANRRALVVGAGLQATQQLSGFNALMYYSASIFATLGYRNGTAVGLLIAIVNFLFTLLALRTVDSFGRRKTMLYTVPIMAIALALTAVFFHRLTLPTGGVLLPDPELPYSPLYGSLVLASMLLFVAGYALGSGNIPWQQGELFPLEVRGVGTSICTAVNWSSNLVVGATFLSLLRVATPSGAFAIYAILCSASWMFCFLCYPETAGLSLEEVTILFQRRYGVYDSRDQSSLH